MKIQNGVIEFVNNNSNNKNKDWMIEWPNEKEDTFSPWPQTQKVQTKHRSLIAAGRSRAQQQLQLKLVDSREYIYVNKRVNR